MGIWVFYYLRFTNYAGIGIIETFLFIAATASEIPTGAIADLFGKKNTLVISFLLQTLGMSILALFPHLSWVIFGALIGGIGGSFYSGTLDALVYDSLKVTGKEKLFDKIISKITSISLISPAICGIIGGFLYVIKPNLPFFANALFYFLAIPLVLFFVEPNIKEKKTFSFQNFFQQMKYGFRELFKSSIIIEQTILLVITGSIAVICLQMLNDFLGVEFGFKPTQLAIVWAFLYVICAGVSYLTPILGKYISYKTLAISLGFIIAFSLIVSPFLGVATLILGGISIGIRAISQTIYENVSSVLVNENTQSQYRTTTLSTFNLLKNIPYMFSAYFLGTLADKISSIHVAFFLGIILLGFILLQTVVFRKKI